jgi:UDP:flavonoid glycosyltransferase YjiC (YdhE family)
MSRAFVFASPVAVGHTRPLMPLARRLARRGYHVVWAISGDYNEPASAWRGQIEELGARFVDLDNVAPFSREQSPEIVGGSTPFNLMRRIAARANDVSEGAAAAITSAVEGREIVGGIYDFFALWAYVTMRRLGIARIDTVVSAFPAILGSAAHGAVDDDDEVFRREIAKLRASGFLDAPLRGFLPDNPALRVLNFSSPLLCGDAPAFVRVLGVQGDALPRVEDLAKAPANDRALVERLQRARAEGRRVVLLSMGTMIMRLFMRRGPEYVAYLGQLYSRIAAAALREGAVVLASTTDLTPAQLGIDEATLGPAARDRVIAMPFVPQPLLLAHGVIDVMLMHGGANTFHEVMLAGVPVLVSPGFGDQSSVANAAARLGVGVAMQSITYPALHGAMSLDRVVESIVPAMLAPGTNHWKIAAADLAARLHAENGLDAAEALLVAAG